MSVACLVCDRPTDGGAFSPDICGPCWNAVPLPHADAIAKYGRLRRAIGQLLHELGHGYLMRDCDAALAMEVVLTECPAHDYGNGPTGALKR